MPTKACFALRLGVWRGPAPGHWFTQHAGNGVFNVEAERVGNGANKTPNEAVGFAIEVTALKSFERTQWNSSKRREFFRRHPAQDPLAPEVLTDGPRLECPCQLGLRQLAAETCRSRSMLAHDHPIHPKSSSERRRRGSAQQIQIGLRLGTPIFKGRLFRRFAKMSHRLVSTSEPDVDLA